ncbi:MAG: DUF2516 family protein [Actinobacteria bacterium]|uniref:Unannotated protein n=1 Tax=freshwater metagenome TaxID=449393 RepID=A0A6J6N5E1_9ZZZZ|nr:DUF2516 family protein [Actinomycetota bacterium]MSY67285.1 DUF2516 family protein [Actinomycetota bacterium]MTA01421.1 DUF2516 family protein [Actinomycetota bacterium]
MESILNPLGSLSTYVILAISVAELIALSFALFHAVRTPSAAFPAAGKQSKQFWGFLLGAALLARLTFASPLDLFGVIAAVAAIVYLVDVKPAVTDVLRGPRW